MASPAMISVLRALVPLLSVFVAALNCPAAEDGGEKANGAVIAGRQGKEWNLQLTSGFLPRADLPGLAGDAAITDYRFRLNRNWQVNGDWTLSLGGGYGLKDIDATPAVLLPEQLHALFLEVGGNYRISDRSFASLRLTPGFYGDFRKLGGDDLRMPILALGGYSFANGFSLVGGFIYRLGYHSSSFIPALGFSYQPDPRWRFDAVAPRPAITYIPSARYRLFLAGDFASDEYELHEQGLGAGAIKYADFKVLAGVECQPDPAVKLSVAAGYAFERKFAFYDSTRPDLKVADAPIVRANLEFGW